MIRLFFELWFVVTLVAFVWAWIFSKKEKKIARFWLTRATISAVIALAFIVAGLFLNNISGV